MAFGEASGGEGALNHILVGAPVKKIGKDHAGKKRGKGCRVSWPADGVELVGLGGQKDIEADTHATLAQ